MHRLLLILLPLLLRGEVASAAEPSTQPVDHTQRFHAFLEEDWQRQLRNNPVWASALGDKRYNDQLEDASVEAAERRHGEDVASLRTLRSIPREALSPEDQLNYDLFRRQRENEIAEYGLLLWQGTPLDAYRGLVSMAAMSESLPFDTAQDYRDWLARLRAMPRMLSQYQQVMRAGVSRRAAQPKITTARLPQSLKNHAPERPEDSPFFSPFRNFPPEVDAREAAELRSAALQVIENEVSPAWRDVAEYIETEYLPAAREDVGLWSIPDGEKAYAFLVRRHTTTNLTPDEVHEIGLAEVARIRGRMEALRVRVGFDGTLRQFLDSLRTDKRFFYQTGDELLEATRQLAKGRIEPLLPQFFNRLPKTSFVVTAIPAASAPLQPVAYYQPLAQDGSRPGTYYVNTYAPESRPKWAMTALSLHEAVPGHHLQIALAMEAGAIPQFRRHADFTAFVEGWGLYAEHLGYEMGLYKDPYDEMGALTFEMWRAIRLVVDTGIHHKRWTRQQAVDYFLENGSQTRLDVETEVDRYITWPGQALAYKIGELRIKKLRREAEERLGDRFDLKAFHDELLRHGAVPLDVLEALVRRWIEQR